MLGAVGGIQHPDGQGMLLAIAQLADHVLALVHLFGPQPGDLLPVQGMPAVHDDDQTARGGFIWIAC